MEVRQISNVCSLTTGMDLKVGPRLRESHLLAPSGRGGEFTQPRAYLLADPYLEEVKYRDGKKGM